MINKDRPVAEPKETSVLTSILLFCGLFWVSGLLRRGAALFTSWLISVAPVEAIPYVKLLGALLALVLTVGLVLLYARFGEGRSLRSLGFTRHKALNEYLKGAATGFGLIAAIVLLCWAFGGVRFVGFGGFELLPFFAALLLGVLNVREEVLFRAWFLNSLRGTLTAAAAIAVSSIAFGLIHLSNANATLLAIVNLVLMGAFLGLYFVRTGNIWGVAAIHTFWNFTQGRICGLSVSGSLSNGSLLQFAPTDEGIFGVGAFGLEGSWAATIVILAAIVLTAKNFSTFANINRHKAA